MLRRRVLKTSLAASSAILTESGAVALALWRHRRNYNFCDTIPREMLGNYLSRSICMEGLLNGRGNLNDNICMLIYIGAKYIARSICLWGGEADLLQAFRRVRQQLPRVREGDPEMILETCIFEIVTLEVKQVPAPGWASTSRGLPWESEISAAERFCICQRSARAHGDGTAAYPT